MEAPTATPSNTSPDWSQQIEEIHCPLCEYNLRGLTEPRCPECGHTFEWRILLDPTQRVHPYLFEHHPNRNVWSYLQTLLGAMSPQRFWSSLLPMQPSNARRLVLYWLIGILPSVAMLAVLFVEHANEQAARTRSYRASVAAGYAQNPAGWQPAIDRYGSFKKFVEDAYPLPPQWEFFQQTLRASADDAQLTLLAAYCVWPWVATLILMIFRASMHRTRIGRVHVLRCTIYSADAGPILAGAMVWIALEALSGIILIAGIRTILLYGWWIALALVWGTITVRLIQAYRRYLRFPHAVGVVFAVQLIFFLLVVQVAVYRGGFDAVQHLFVPR